MKFFSNLGSCYRPTGLPVAEVSATGTPTTTTTAQMALPCNGGGGHGPCSKRIKKVTAGSSAAHWRPALSVISEDGVVSVFESEDQRKSQPEKNKLPSRSTAKPRCFRSNDEYDYDNFRKSSMPMILPAFSPTPFLF